MDKVGLQLHTVVAPAAAVLWPYIPAHLRKMLCSPRAAELATAAASGGLAVFGILWFRDWLRRRRELRQFKADLTKQMSFDDLDGKTASSGSMFGGQSMLVNPGGGLTEDAEELVREQLARNIAFLGEEGVARCRRSFVIVVGLGGVGSHAAHMLLRSGIEHMRLIDFDQVTLSSLNRHAVARRSDVGTFKTIAMQKHFRDIVPHARVEAIVELFSKDSAARLLDGNPDYVLDCIDNIATKVDLLEYCHKNKIPVISSMGSGAKADASRIQIADISDTYEDPLARATRKTLRLRGIDQGITVVYSTERPGNVKLLPLMETQVDEANDYAPLPHFRSRILPVLGTLPALFGNAMASYVITELGGYQTDPLPFKTKRKVTDKMYGEFINRQRDKNIPIKITAHDVAFIVEETWGGKSALSSVASDRLFITRWNPRKPMELGNLLCMTRAEADKHEKLAPEEFEAVYGKEFVDKVNQKFEIEQRYRKWRIEP
ncbi:hypothetical protein BC831DRAFT_459505 [Entophlyctis helioformis]|nr:hypothetical protein BC831DRAFT_459505 [Entophlyctis helioformis]